MRQGLNKPKVGQELVEVRDDLELLTLLSLQACVPAPA